MPLKNLILKKIHYEVLGILRKHLVSLIIATFLAPNFLANKNSVLAEGIIIVTMTIEKETDEEKMVIHKDFY